MSAGVVFTAFSVARHERFGSGAWDMGCHVHNLFILGFGRPLFDGYDMPIELDLLERDVERQRHERQEVVGDARHDRGARREQVPAGADEVQVLELRHKIASQAQTEMGKEQRDYAKKALAENKDVRWTIVILHKPIWTATDLAKSGWGAVESALAAVQMLEPAPQATLAGRSERVDIANAALINGVMP